MINTLQILKVVDKIYRDYEMPISPYALEYVLVSDPSANKVYNIDISGYDRLQFFMASPTYWGHRYVDSNGRFFTIDAPRDPTPTVRYLENADDSSF